MRIYDLIAKKRDGGVHTRAELETLINGYVAGDVPDYQMAAWMTDIMAHSGEMVDLSPIAGVKVDKHSTGGVGDKTTLVIAPIAAACGVKIAKMSGRGLGHTGGTIDKMESVPGTRTALSQEEFFAQVNRTGIAVIGQSENIAVADKKMYALRDVTATVSCIPLIASSIMSKKLASGSDAILLDVTTGTGAFMKTVEESIQLARLMVAIGAHHGRKVAAMITDMDTPLGHNIGNSLEVMESMEVLKGRGPADLTAVCIELAAYMLVLAGKGSPDECRALARQAIADGSAFAKCREMFAAQGGDVRVLDDYSLFAQPAARYELLADADGYITANDAEKIGTASVLLGAGREKKGDPIDYAAGIILHKKRQKAGRLRPPRPSPGHLLRRARALCRRRSLLPRRAGHRARKARRAAPDLRHRDRGRRAAVLKQTGRPLLPLTGNKGLPFLSKPGQQRLSALGRTAARLAVCDVRRRVVPLAQAGGIGRQGFHRPAQPRPLCRRQSVQVAQVFAACLPGQVIQQRHTQLHGGYRFKISRATGFERLAGAAGIDALKGLYVIVSVSVMPTFFNAASRLSNFNNVSYSSLPW